VTVSALALLRDLCRVLDELQAQQDQQALLEDASPT